jgi:50S ribosomal protein L16 3-hydroxylase
MCFTCHEGEALGECLTCSIGFRAPRFQELVPAWHAWLEESTRLVGNYRDPGLKPTRSPARLPAQMIDAVFHTLARRRPTRSDAEATLLRALSEPKPAVVFDPPKRSLSPRAFLSNATKRGVALDRRTRLLYCGRRGAINGDLLATPVSAALRGLADHRMIMGREAMHLVESQVGLLYEWYVAGWLHLLRSRSSDA